MQQVTNGPRFSSTNGDSATTGATALAPSAPKKKAEQNSNIGYGAADVGMEGEKKAGFVGFSLTDLASAGYTGTAGELTVILVARGEKNGTITLADVANLSEARRDYFFKAVAEIEAKKNAPLRQQAKGLEQQQKLAEAAALKAEKEAKRLNQKTQNSWRNQAIKSWVGRRIVGLVVGGGLTVAGVGGTVIALGSNAAGGIVLAAGLFMSFIGGPLTAYLRDPDNFLRD